MNEIIRIPFTRGELLTIDVGGRPYVVLRHAFEAIGVDVDRQINKVQKQVWATTATTAVVAADGKTRQMVVADVRTFLMCLATIPATRVRPEIRPVLSVYQSETADAIEAYWTRGKAINPRNAMEKFYEPNTYSWDEAAALVHQRTGVPVAVNELTRILRSGGVLKQTGAPRKEYRHWFWFTGSAWNIHPHVIRDLIYKVFTVGRDLQDARFTQARLEFEGSDRVVSMEERRRRGQVSA